ncbi:MAG: hypothetical protein ACAH06_11555 [Methylophilaceae bacterium]
MAKKIWRTNRTILLVGEGADEKAFLTHVKNHFAPRDCGKTVIVKNAQGKGATHVVEWTIRQMGNAQYDDVAVMVDTDTGWTKAAIALAERASITLLPSDPRFEAVLLRLLGKSPRGDSQAMKRQFAPLVQQKSTEIESYAREFGPDILLANRSRELSIDTLLKILDV